MDHETKRLLQHAEDLNNSIEQRLESEERMKRDREWEERKAKRDAEILQRKAASEAKQ